MAASSEPREAAEAAGMNGRIRFLGQVDKRRVPRVLADADIFLNTTHVDNTPVSVVEAWPGLCVVTTNVGGIPYLVRHEQEALLVPPAMPAAWRRRPPPAPAGRPLRLSQPQRTDCRLRLRQFARHGLLERPVREPSLRESRPAPMKSRFSVLVGYSIGNTPVSSFFSRLCMELTARGHRAKALVWIANPLEARLNPALDFVSWYLPGQPVGWMRDSIGRRSRRSGLMALSPTSPPSIG